MKKQRIEHGSIHLNYPLRHAPKSARLDLDHQYRVSVAPLIENVNASGKAQLTIELQHEIVATD